MRTFVEILLIASICLFNFGSGGFWRRWIKVVYWTLGTHYENFRDRKRDWLISSFSALAGSTSIYFCTVYTYYFRKSRQLLPNMSQDFILVCGEEGGEPCEVLSTITLDSKGWNQTLKTLLPPGASGARRFCGAGEHSGSVPCSHWHQISQPSNSGLLLIDIVLLWFHQKSWSIDHRI